jgi:hypothetical protein
MTGLATYIDQMMSLFPDRQYNRSKLRSISDECTNYTGTHNYLFDKRFHKHYELYLDLLQSDGMTREQLHSWSRLLRNLADNNIQFSHYTKCNFKNMCRYLHLYDQ